MNWQPSTVTTLDGRSMLSNTEEFRAYCEAHAVLTCRSPYSDNYREMIEKMRGAAGVKTLEAEIERIAPAYVLSLPNKAARQEFLARLERRDGASSRKALEQRVVALWEARKAQGAAS